MITPKAEKIVKVIQSCRSFEQLKNAQNMRRNLGDNSKRGREWAIDDLILKWEILKKETELIEKANDLNLSH